MADWCIMADRRHSRARPDPIGLRAATQDRLLIAVVAAMSFLASLAMAGDFATSTLAAHWLGAARNVLTIEVPDPSASVQTASSVTRLDAVLAALRQQPTLSGVRALSPAELGHLLKPWLGHASASGDAGIVLPGVIMAQGDARRAAVTTLRQVLNPIAPGTLVEAGGGLAARLTTLTESLQASAAAILLIVAAVAASVVGVSVRAGLAQRREAIDIIHGLGARDSDIAGPFARDIAQQAGLGGVLGGLAALPVLLWLGRLAAGFALVPHSAGRGMAATLATMPALLWAGPMVLMLAAALIGWVVARTTVLGWLRHLT
jgi:cell division transport system permease protein